MSAEKTLVRELQVLEGLLGVEHVGSTRVEKQVEKINHLIRQAPAKIWVDVFLVRRSVNDLMRKVTRMGEKHDSDFGMVGMGDVFFEFCDVMHGHDQEGRFSQLEHAVYDVLDGLEESKKELGADDPDRQEVLKDLAFHTQLLKTYLGMVLRDARARRKVRPAFDAGYLGSNEGKSVREIDPRYRRFRG